MRSYTMRRLAEQLLLKLFRPIRRTPGRLRVRADLRYLFSSMVTRCSESIRSNVGSRPGVPQSSV